MKNKIYFILALISILGLLTSCKKPILSKFTGKAQGTTYSITYYEKKGISVANEIDNLLENFNKTASIYDSTSIISKINKNIPVQLNNDFREIFKRSVKISQETGGTFDFTVRPLVKAFGFDADNNLIFDEKTIAYIKKYVGYNKIRINGDTIQKDDPRVSLDFNAIAQGYSVDLVAALLESKGIENYLIEIGGEVYAKGKKDDGNNWVIGIEKPLEKNEKRELSAKVILENRALATSGSYRKFYNRNGKRVSHIIDPVTGYPVTHSLLSVTVFASNCTDADAYATAFMVMGLEKSKEFLSRHQELDAFFIFSDTSGNFITYKTEGLKDKLAELP